MGAVNKSSLQGMEYARRGSHPFGKGKKMEMPENFDYSNFLDMAKWNLMGILSHLSNDKIPEAKECCRESLRTIERLKGRLLLP